MPSSIKSSNGWRRGIPPPQPHSARYLLVGSPMSDRGSSLTYTSLLSPSSAFCPPMGHESDEVRHKPIALKADWGQSKARKSKSQNNMLVTIWCTVYIICFMMLAIPSRMMLIRWSLIIFYTTQCYQPSVNHYLNLNTKWKDLELLTIFFSLGCFILELPN